MIGRDLLKDFQNTKKARKYELLSVTPRGIEPVSCCNKTPVNKGFLKQISTSVTASWHLQHIEQSKERRISNTPVNENNDLSISLFFWYF